MGLTKQYEQRQDKALNCDWLFIQGINIPMRLQPMKRLKAHRNQHVISPLPCYIARFWYTISFFGSATEGSLMHTLLNIQFQVRLSIHVWTFPFLSNERTSQKVEHKRNFSQCDKMWPDNSMKSLCSLYRSPFHNSWISQNEGDSHELSFPGQKPRLAKNILAHEEYD